MHENYNDFGSRKVNVVCGEKQPDDRLPETVVVLGSGIAWVEWPLGEPRVRAGKKGQTEL